MLRFETAGKYFDSASTRYLENTKEQRAALKKRENLADVILYENNRRSADSVLSIISMSESERTDFYNNYIRRTTSNENHS